MFRTIAKILIGTVVAVVIAIFATVTFADRWLGQLIADELTSWGSKNRLSILLTEPSANLRRVVVREGRVFITAALTEISFTNLLINLSPTTVITGHPEAQFSAQIYGGALDGVVRCNFLCTEISLTAHLRDVKLSRHPQLGAAGISSGELTINVQELLVKRDGAPIALRAATLELKDLGKAKPSSVPGGLFIPEFGRINITGSAYLNSQVLTINSLSLGSDYLTSEAESTINLNSEGRVSDFKASGIVDIREAGAPLISPWLPRLSQGALSDSARRFKILATGEEGEIKVEFLAAE